MAAEECTFVSEAEGVPEICAQSGVVAQFKLWSCLPSLIKSAQILADSGVPKPVIRFNTVHLITA